MYLFMNDKFIHNPIVREDVANAMPLYEPINIYLQFRAYNSFKIIFIAVTLHLLLYYNFFLIANNFFGHILSTISYIL